MKKEKKVVALEVVETKTGKVIKTVPLTNPTERYVERVMMGMLRNMNTDEYHVAEKYES